MFYQCTWQTHPCQWAFMSVVKLRDLIDYDGYSICTSGMHVLLWFVAKWLPRNVVATINCYFIAMMMVLTVIYSIICLRNLLKTGISNRNNPRKRKTLQKTQVWEGILTLGKFVIPTIESILSQRQISIINIQINIIVLFSSCFSILNKSKLAQCSL